MDVQVHDLKKKVEERFGQFLPQMNREEIILAEKEEERLRIILYKTKGEKDFPLKKVAFMILENGWVWNKDDRKLLDEDEIIVGSFIPIDDIPLPFLAIEASLHFGKYDHLNVDIFPLSKDKKYREIFCKPVKDLRGKNEGLDGLLPGVRTPSLLGEYTSGGIYLYKDFLEDREKYSVLKEPTVIEEGKEIKEVFLSRYRKETPRILSDIPHLHSEEKGKKLGELLF
jgi:hypothetical protein